MHIDEETHGIEPNQPIANCDEGDHFLGKTETYGNILPVRLSSQKLIEPVECPVCGETFDHNTGMRPIDFHDSKVNV